MLYIGGLVAHALCVMTRCWRAGAQLSLAHWKCVRTNGFAWNSDFRNKNETQLSWSRSQLKTISNWKFARGQMRRRHCFCFFLFLSKIYGMEPLSGAKLELSSITWTMNDERGNWHIAIVTVSTCLANAHNNVGILIGVCSLVRNVMYAISLLFHVQRRKKVHQIMRTKIHSFAIRVFLTCCCRSCATGRVTERNLRYMRWQPIRKITSSM